ncbi:uncharacterized protein LOC129720145 [Wyeomyia smithii]|uniref:uncharacterized protein LOC129720145 n=1 Tax=Wyeomyia smithii TaxID=174621 RepID=UPI002467B90A|nr:uncharacterized protein LOC129720145 [Wyeomyia smithii]
MRPTNKQLSKRLLCSYVNKDMLASEISRFPIIQDSSEAALRYSKKIRMFYGTDPFVQIYQFLVLDKSPYTGEPKECAKGLDAIMYFKNGWVKNVSGKQIRYIYVVHGLLSVTDLSAYWRKPPSSITEDLYKKVRDIDFGRKIQKLYFINNTTICWKSRYENLLRSLQNDGINVAAMSTFCSDSNIEFTCESCITEQLLENSFQLSLMQVHVCEASSGYFYVWSPRDTLLLEIKRNDRYWSFCRNKAELFSKSVVLPELLSKKFTE